MRPPGTEPSRDVTTCKVGQAVRSLPREDGVLLTEWAITGLVDGEPVPASVMTVALAENGHPLSASTVKAHRRRDCLCFR